MQAFQEKDILKRLIQNDALFDYIYVFNQKFDILPQDHMHYGTHIQYQDIQELRDDFLNELLDSIVNWVYSSEKYKYLQNEILKKGKSIEAANSEIIRKAKKKFRGNRSAEHLLIQGQLGELLLFHFIQRYMKAVPLLRKMPITTSAQHERFGADAIHYKIENGKNIMILGEAKTYTSKYKFKEAFEDALKSIITTYNNLRDELNLYVHEDFLDNDMNNIAEAFLCNRLPNTEIHLVSIILYNENKQLNLTDENDIKAQIRSIIQERYKSFDNSKINIKDNPILKRITYIVFPIWKLEELAMEFQQLI